MLQSLRDRMSGVVAWFIVGLLIIPFAFFGIDQFTTGNANPEVASVGDRDITLREFRNAYNQRYQRLVQMLGENFDPSTLDRGVMRQAVLEDMIQQEARLQYAQANGWRVSDQALVEFLQEVPAFQRDGRFSAEAYRELLAQQGMSPQRYEQQLREGLRAEQLRNAVVNSSFVVPEEVTRARAVRDQLRSFAAVRVPASRFLGEIEVEEEALQAAYEANREAYRVPERVKLAYVELDRDSIAEGQPEPSESVLKRIYESESKVRFSSPERREVRHILAEGENARERIQEAAKRIEEGASFAEVAETVSDDSGSAEEGGSLGWIERGDMVPAFEEVAFSLPPDTVSDPVESEFGWHLIRVESVEEKTTKPFDDPEVQEQLTRMYREREADVAFREALDQVERIAFEQAASLEPAADAVGLEIKTTDWLPRGSGEGLLSHPEVAQAVFSDTVTAGENSRPLELAPGRVVVIRQRDYEPARVRALEEVRGQVMADVRAERARAKAREVANAIQEAVKSGASLAEAAESRNLEAQEADKVRRGSNDWDGRVLNTVFALPRPDAVETAPVRTVDLGEEGIAVVRLQAVHEPEAPSTDEVDQRTLVRRIQGRAAGTEFSGLEQHILQSVEVSRNEQVAELDEGGQPR